MVQRLRITFARHNGVKYLAHLELMRMWERALRRAGWRPVYSQGFNPHPKINFAAALPVGVAGDAELMEVQLEIPRPVEQAAGELAAQLPSGFELRGVQEFPLDAPTLQRSLRAAEYVARCPQEVSEEQLHHQAERLLAAAQLIRERKKESKVQSYDLRPMIHVLEVNCDLAGYPVVRMTLRADAQGAGRPDEVLREMGIDPAGCDITRTQLLMSISWPLGATGAE